jgi:hypothetical protein
MNRAKQLQKLIQVLTDADNCTTRKKAQKLLKKALKIDKKLQQNGTN